MLKIVENETQNTLIFINLVKNRQLRIGAYEPS